MFLEGVEDEGLGKWGAGREGEEGAGGGRGWGGVVEGG